MSFWRLLVLLIATVATQLGLAESCAGEELAGSAGEPVQFDREVMAVLSKAGCNAGTCHGNKNGKGGFKLSLRGQDPIFDFESLTRGQSGRRLNRAQPDASLLLLKPTMDVPHEGGRRFSAGTLEYRLLREWIAAGATRTAGLRNLSRLIVHPTDVAIPATQSSIRAQVIAEYEDGSKRDVTTLTTFEPIQPEVHVSGSGLVQLNGVSTAVVIARFLGHQSPIRIAVIPDRPNWKWNGPEAANLIDEHIFARLQQLKTSPSPVCDDVTFIRRAFLDLTGLLPSADKARQFVGEQSADKRSRLVDELLERQEYADYQAQRWADLLRIEEKTLDRKGVENFYAWVRHQLATNRPVNEFVHELISGRGSSYTNPTANFYRAMRSPPMRAESTAQLFLGVRLGCARCHNHPFDQWTQEDYYGWSNLFARVEYEVISNNRRDRNDKHEFDGEQIVWMKHEGDVEHPSGSIITPRFLDSQRRDATSGKDRLLQLADWLTDTTNERFAESLVNRTWAHFMGRGLVDPIDDFRATNPPSHPELLKGLAHEFVEHGFDQRHLVRLIMNSQTYQLSSSPSEPQSATEDVNLFSHGILRRLSAEQLCDAVSRVTARPIEFNGYPIGTRATQIPGTRAIRARDASPSSGDQFLILFGKPPRLTACDCERSDETTLSQAFQLISGPLLNELLTADSNRLRELLDSSQTDEQIVTELYWTALSRPPSVEEQRIVTRLLASSTHRRRALEDVAWGLMNSSEFLFRR